MRLRARLTRRSSLVALCARDQCFCSEIARTCLIYTFFLRAIPRSRLGHVGADCPTPNLDTSRRTRLCTFIYTRIYHYNIVIDTDNRHCGAERTCYIYRGDGVRMLVRQLRRASHGAPGILYMIATIVAASENAEGQIPIDR